ncbi:hypothetical protein QUA82_14460 [Microcoleus sp. F8-D3]
MSWRLFLSERVTASPAIPCPQKQTMKRDRSHFQKYWLFFTRYFELLPVQVFLHGTV